MYDDKEMYFQVLDILNNSSNKEDTIKHILYSIKKYTNIEAIGIRLKVGFDFPYYTTSGFSDDFIRSEYSLCSKGTNGELIRDSKGNPVLECMCGNVICGRTNASKPFFTQSGSFWSNCTTQLLASTTEEDRQSRTRNHCNGEGYESVALIPLKTSDKTIGLLQLNDKKKNCFTLDRILFFEKLGLSIGIAMYRREAENRIRILNKNLEKLVNERTLELRKALDQKELLLKEIHHRVKNNLQIISSLLSLQTKYKISKKTKIVIMDIICRIQSMRILHQKLYENENLNLINIKDYIDDIIAEIFSAHCVKSNLIKIKNSINNIYFNIDTAIPCGLIITEIITNSIKYAFPDNKDGLIFLEINKNDEFFILEIGDNGVGTKKDIKQVSTLGMTIIFSLAKQLDGYVDINTSCNGIRYKIFFKEEIKDIKRWRRNQ